MTATTKHAPETPAQTSNELQKKLQRLNELTALREEIRGDLVAAIEQNIRQLSELGFHYELSEVAGAGKTRKAGTKKALHCEICKLDGHDRRAHRKQKPQAPFTQDELKARGLV